MSEQKPIIYLFCVPAEGWGKGDVVGHALAEDGTYLGGHLSSNAAFSKHDMGLTSTWKHDRYAQHYPAGYQMEWVDDVETHAGLGAAIERQRTQAVPND